MTNALIDAIQTKDTFTENGMATHSTSGNYNLDLFFRGGAMRTADEQEILKVFANAFEEDALLAMKILFWIRDVRGGAGERRFFKTVLNGLMEHYPDIVLKNLHLIPEFGRWDEVAYIYDRSSDNERLHLATLSLIKQGLEDGNSLLAKWLPRKGNIAVKLRTELGWSPKRYRKTLVTLTKVVETQMCAQEWDKIEYSKVPSVAMSRYRKTFSNHDGARFLEFSNKVIDGEEKINTGAVYPYDVLKAMYNEWTRIHKPTEPGIAKNIIAQWRSLPNFMENSENFRMLPICDTSGSMCVEVSGSTSALQVCIALGLYIAERNMGVFKDYFITFSNEPELQKLVGPTIIDKALNLSEANWGMNTDLVKTFDLVLNAAVKHNVPQNEMPTHLLILSDMEFDEATSNSSWGDVTELTPTAMEMIKSKYSSAGYEVPNIIYWNLNSKQSNIPVKVNEMGTALVSGFSPQILTSLLKGSLNPRRVMLDTIEVERYSGVRV